MIQFLQSLFGKRKPRTLTDELPLDINSTVRRLAGQHAEAASRGERIVNRMPSSVRMNFLKSAILEKLQQMDYEKIGISKEVVDEIEEIDFEGAMGTIGKSFDALLPRLPTSTLQKIEAEVRTADAASSKPQYDDIALLLD
jgi:hypothetical protein